MMFQMDVNPMKQFVVKPWIEIGPVAGVDISFTNASFYMLLAVALIVIFFMVATSKRAMVPGRLQSVGEVGYEFIGNMIRDTIGAEGYKFFPLVFSLFFFIFFANMIGMVPYAFTTTSQIILTVALAILVFATVIIYGFIRNGLGFLKLFAPSGVPWPMLLFLVPLEVFSFFVRPVTLSIRLFANILAGHIVLKMFATFTVMLLGAASAVSIIAPLPFLMGMAITALEFLVSFLQAYVFAILTCIYLADAFHPSH